MKNTFWLSMTLVCFLCASIALAQENKGPRIELKEMQHDFGKVASGTQASHVFEVRNAGDEPLVIERVQST
jgi:hypothetical protein